MSDTIEFNTVSLEEWKQIPAPVPPKPKDRFEKLIASVRAGNIVKLEVTEEKALRGMRIGIARKARNAGFLVHTWPEDGRHILALLSGGYESRKTAKQATKSASQAGLHCIVSAKCNDQYVYREP